MRLSDDLQEAIGKSRAILRTPFPWWLRPLLAGGVSAITLGRRVYISADVAEKDLEQLLRHELVHVEQVARLGAIRFYWRYIAEYVTLRRRGLSPPDAYRKISFEVEAFEAEKNL